MIRARTIGPRILAVFLLTPGLIITSFFVIFLLLILTGSAASAHPAGAPAVFLSLGLTFSFWGHETEDSLRRETKTLLIAVGLGFVVAGGLLLHSECQRLRCEPSSTRSAVAVWSLLSLGAVALVAGLLNNRRLALIFTGAAAVALAELALLAFFIALWALFAPFGYV